VTKQIFALQGYALVSKQGVNLAQLKSLLFLIETKHSGSLSKLSACAYKLNFAIYY
tara:strand:- start:2594 stop:2761 length:168 start_codon:yes stop_codon:yes gene_type:complete